MPPSGGGKGGLATYSPATVSWYILETCDPKFLFSPPPGVFFCCLSHQSLPGSSRQRTRPRGQGRGFLFCFYPERSGFHGHKARLQKKKRPKANSKIIGILIKLADCGYGSGFFCLFESNFYKPACSTTTSLHVFLGLPVSPRKLAGRIGRFRRHVVFVLCSIHTSHTTQRAGQPRQVGSPSTPANFPSPSLVLPFFKEEKKRQTASHPQTGP